MRKKQLVFGDASDLLIHANSLSITTHTVCAGMSTMARLVDLQVITDGVGHRKVDHHRTIHQL